MTANADSEYELVLMLDPEIPDERREQIASEARKRIESGGTLKHDTAWGMRKLAYEIRQRTEADYRFFRFETGGELLGELNHNLRIADGVLRFRVFKVDPRTPLIVPPPALPTPAGAPGRGDRRPRPGADREAPAPAPEGEEAAEAAEAPEAAEPAEAEQQPSEEQPTEEAAPPDAEQPAEGESEASD